MGFESIWAQDTIVVCWITSIFWIRLAVLF